MSDVDRTGAPYARRARRRSLQLLAASACWWVAAAASAQDAPPSAVPPSGAAQPASPGADSSRRSPWRALDRDVALDSEKPPSPPPQDTPDSAGSLVWEIAGGTLPVVAGVALFYTGLRAHGPGGHVPTFGGNIAQLSIGVLLCVVGPPIGVTVAGNATGGTGRVGFTFLGALGGAILSLPGVVIGSIIGYRASADEEPPRSHATLAPVVGRDEVGVQWSGQL
jgi:hypothetical protein